MTSTISTLAPEQHITFELKFGARLHVEAPAGGHPLQVLAVVAGDPRDRFSAANTLAINKSAYLAENSVLLSYFCQPLLKLVRDDAGGHSLMPPPVPATSEGRARAAAALQLLDDAGKDIGLAAHQVPQPAQLFVRHTISEDGHVSATTVSGEPSARLELKAEMDVVVALIGNPFIAAENESIAGRSLTITIEEPRA